MYGFLKPKDLLAREKEKYRKYVCTLCNSLHKNYGIKGRLLTNYNCSTLALVIGSINETLDRRVVDSKRLCFCVSKNKETSIIFDFLSAVSVMLVYSKFLDKAIEDKQKMPKWIIKMSNTADVYLSKFGLGKRFFETKLKEQHELEKKCKDLETLCIPTNEIVAKILRVACELNGKEEYSNDFEKLGIEIGKLIYVHDALLDYEEDLNKGSFNCIGCCYTGNKTKLKEIPKEIVVFIETVQKNISLILKKIDIKKYNIPIKKILLQDSIFSIRSEERSKGLFSNYSQRELIGQKVYGFFSTLPLVVINSNSDPYCGTGASSGCEFFCIIICCLVCCCGCGSSSYHDGF